MYSRVSDKDHMASGCVAILSEMKLLLLFVSVCAICQDCAIYIYVLTEATVAADLDISMLFGRLLNFTIKYNPLDI